MTLARPIRLFLGGDTMTGRGIDQILRHPSEPRLHEAWVGDARDYIRLAETRSGAIPRPVSDRYVWGDLLDDLAAAAPDLRIVNLETAITLSDAAEAKGINYRMHPANAGVLTAAGIDACTLANNHVLDWGRAGLVETMETLRARGIAFAGAGMTEREAWAPCIMRAGDARVLLVACASRDSGVPAHWAAGPDSPGIALLPDRPQPAADRIAQALAPIRRPGDRLVVSIHWGGNWGFAVPQWQADLAHDLVARVGADIVFGHSAHHAKAAELHLGRLVLYGCGDLLNDYEGIGGHEAYPADIAASHLVAIDPAHGRLRACRIRPYTVRRFRLARAGARAAARFAAVMTRECAARGLPVTEGPTGDLVLGG